MKKAVPQVDETHQKTMKASADPEFERYKDVDFARAKPIAQTPHLLRLQLANGVNTRGATPEKNPVVKGVHTR